MKPLEYIYAESARQSATVSEMAGMCTAYLMLLEYDEDHEISDTMIRALSLHITGISSYRLVSATFNQGPPAVKAENIPRLMENLVEAINLRRESERKFEEVTLKVFVMEFLMIHPFADGNGRVASLLYNFLKGTMIEPTPLPYYFGEN